MAGVGQVGECAGFAPATTGPGPDGAFTWWPPGLPPSTHPTQDGQATVRLWILVCADALAHSGILRAVIESRWGRRVWLQANNG
jgi:hypothetical protein